MTNSDFQSTARPVDLVKRAAILRQIRAFFDEHGFVEVQTPVLSQDVVIDRHLEPMVVEVPGGPRRHGDDLWFLQTSPEQNMKRLLASGLQAIYQIGPVFRMGEVGRLHNPEFTMLEWYRVGDDYEAGIRFLAELVQNIIPLPPAKRVTYWEAFSSVLGLKLEDYSASELAELCLRSEWIHTTEWSDDIDDWLDLIFSTAIQPQLGFDAPVIVTHFPASQAALAKISPANPKTAERFEFFYQGIELANGYHELVEASTLRTRNQRANELRRKDGKRILPMKNFLIDAMEHGLPECSGCALGLDRLVMLALGAERIESVLAFPWNRA